MKRSERLFAIAEVLRSRRTGVTAEALADRFSVSVRTIHRDLTSLKNARLPLHSERGRGGGFALDKNYNLPPINLSAREAAVLEMLLRFAKNMRLLPFEKSLENISLKIRGALSAEKQRDYGKEIERLEFVGVPAKRVDKKILHAISTAWFEQRPITFKYPRGEYGEQTISAHIRGFVFDRRETRVNITTTQDKQRVVRLHKIISISR